jgi:GDPmannose 4,6-dehydratase
MMLQQEKPDDYVIATGETHSIREFLDLSFHHAGLEWEKYVEIDPDIIGLPKSMLSLATHQKRRSNSAGLRRLHSRNWSGS